MNRKLLLLTISSIAAVMILSGAVQEVQAAIFVKIGDIKGESTDRDHVEWIDLLQVSFAVERDSSAGTSGQTRQRASATFGDLVVVKEVDASTPKLQEAIATGKTIPSVKIDFTQDLEGKRVPYLQWELKNARVSSYSFSGSADSSTVPTEQISLNFEEIKVTYTKFNSDGTEAGKVEYTWKIEEGE